MSFLVFFIKKAPITECLAQMGSLRIHPPLCFFNRRWYACKQRRWRYYPVLPISRKSRIVGTLLSAQIPSGILRAQYSTKVNDTRIYLQQIASIRCCTPDFERLTMGAAA